MKVALKTPPALLVAVCIMRGCIPMVSPGIIWVSAQQTGGPTSAGPTPSNSGSGEPTKPNDETPEPTESPTPAPTPEPTPEPTKSPTPAPVPTMPTGTSNNKCTKNPKKPKDLLTVKVKTGKQGKQVKQNVLTVKRSKAGESVRFSKKVLYKKKFKEDEVNEMNVCIQTQKFCYKLKMTDKKNNGLSDGYVQMFLNDDLLYEDDFDNGSEITEIFGNCN